MPVVTHPTPTVSHVVTGTVTNVAPPGGTGNVSSVGTGPWFIETQSLDVFYERVPACQRGFLADHDVNLSSVLDISGSVNYTYLQCRVEAHYAVVSSSQYFASGLVIPQKFVVHPVSADYQGNTYGTLNPASGHLGPQGEILTASGWYNRRLWAAGDYEIQQSTSGVYNYSFFEFHCPSGGNFYQGAGDLRANFRSVMGSIADAGYKDLTECKDNILQAEKSYWLPGQYAVAQETAARDKTIHLLDYCGENIKTGFRLFGENGERLLGSPGGPLTEYEPGHHDYT